MNCTISSSFVKTDLTCCMVTDINRILIRTIAFATKTS
uniref:Uncharacterized protein n=1 Tax=Lotus japonicus TaxID=34305 RepID=I3SU50_LOTJA|nr:unknown [Lotus japonicus]